MVPTPRRKAANRALGAICTIAAYLVLWPSSVDPEGPWTPPAAVTWAPNAAVAMAERLDLGEEAEGPEAIAIDAAGRIYSGLDDGRILRLAADATELEPGRPELVADTGGRPLGLAFDAAGRLLVADAELGLLAVAPDGQVEVLVGELDGEAIGLVNSLAVARDGVVYFSVSSTRFGLDDHRLDLLEHRGNGQIYAYDPGSRSVALLTDGLYYPNGVALGPDEAFLLVAETGTYRVLRIELTGSERGVARPFSKNLPGFPDGLCFDPRGTVWVALVTPRDKWVDWLLPRPFLRRVLGRLPQGLLPGLRRRSWVLGLDLLGRVTHDLQDDGPDALAPISSVLRRGDYLYLGALQGRVVGRLRAPDAFPWTHAR